MPINHLPDELLVKIMRLFDQSLQPTLDLSRQPKSLLSCCLVCRRWLQLAQPLVFEKVSLGTYGELVQLHSILTNSKHLGPYVRDWQNGFDVYTAGRSDLGMPSRLFADCLKKTTNLEKTSLSLAFKTIGPSIKLVLHGICRLQKLRYLVIHDFHRFDTCTDSDSPLLVLLDLPKTIKKLKIACPTYDLSKLLPKICANLQLTPTASNTEQVGLSVHAQNQTHHVTGLSSLEILVADHPAISPALGHALASTLTSFMYHAPFPDESALIGFLVETPLLEHLCLYYLRISPVLFDGLLPLAQLRSLEIGFLGVPVPTDEDDFCRTFTHFLSQSPHFHTVTAHIPHGDSGFISQFIKALLASTSLNGSFSRLRKLELHCFTSLSIDTFEHMCGSANILQYISVSLPTAPLSRVTSALAQLQQLVSATFSLPNLQDHHTVTINRLNGEGTADLVSKLSHQRWD